MLFIKVLIILMLLLGGVYYWGVMDVLENVKREVLFILGFFLLR